MRGAMGEDAGMTEVENEPASVALKKRFREVAQSAERRLYGAPPVVPAVEFEGLAEEISRLHQPERWDRYGEGGPVEELEAEVMRLLGKPAAVMFPSGVMGQQSVLRVWSDRTGSKRIALPQLSHLLHHELDGPALLHGFRYELLTTGPQVPKVEDLERIPGLLGAALLELPLREAGYLLPTWDELEAFAAACKHRGVPLHLDGARVWESQPHLDKSLSEIAALADSVYVSFYKGLGGHAGAAVAGPEDVIAEVRQWRTRHGGTIFTMLPNAVTALRGLREQLPRMREYQSRAVNLAQRLLPAGITPFPHPPHTNAFRIYVEGDADQVNQRTISFMELEGVAVCPPFEPADAPGWVWTEFTVGPASMDWSAAEMTDVLTRALIA